MNYYPRYMGDYVRDTSHLTMLEDGAYTRLLDYYYSRRAPLPVDFSALYRIARAVTGAEKRAVQRVCEQFFPERDRARHNARADAEIASWERRAQRNRANGSQHVSSKENSQLDMPVAMPAAKPLASPSLASPSPSPTPDKSKNPPTPVPGGSNRSGRKPREERDRSLRAWRQICALVDHVASTKGLTWRHVDEQCGDLSAVTAGEQVGFRLIADRDKFTAKRYEAQFREAYERIAAARSTAAPERAHA